MDLISQLSLMVGLGVAAQWLAWRLGLPSILLLLLFGFAAGPGFGWLEPDRVFGETLFPMVSLAVGLILFEGGMSLKLSELKGTGATILRLVTVGAVATWAVASAAAHYILGMPTSLAILTGSVLVVTGPTVIQPLLRQVRPTRRIRTLLKWEGIAIDPVGATLALLVFESLLAGHGDTWTRVALEGIGWTLIAGGGIGAASAALFVFLLSKYWIPDYLQEVVSLALVLLAFTVSNHVQEESGLLAVTLMGVLMANQKWVTVHHILHFKENLSVLLIATLFTVLSSRVTAESLASLGWREAVFVAVLILFARPFSIWLSTIGQSYSWREKLFVGFLAPRGIVAAAVASLFAIRLEAVGVEGASALVPVVFATIVGTVVVYGLGARPLASRLGLAQRSPQGVLIVGAHPWARVIAGALKGEAVRCTLVDTNWLNVTAARLEGLDTYYGSVLSEEVVDDLDLDGIGKLIAMTPNNEANSLAALHFAGVFGRDRVFQLTPYGHEDADKTRFSPRHLRGRYVFGREWTYDALAKRFLEGASVKTTRITETFNYKAFRELHGASAVPLFTITGGGRVTVISEEEMDVQVPNCRLVYIGS